MQVYKKFIIRLGITVVLLSFGVMLFNYIIDPLWCFDHSYFSSLRQGKFNERQQKSDLLVKHKNNYSILLLGSSRVTYIPSTLFGKNRAFNFAVNAMLPDEYVYYTDFFKKLNNVKPKIIVLGLDFFATNANFKGYNYLQPSVYFENAENKFWRWTVLLSKDVLVYSIKNMLDTLHPNTIDYYDRNAIKHAAYVPEKARLYFVEKDLNIYKSFNYADNYHYKNLKPLLRELIVHNPRSHFYVFTTPDSIELWRLLVSQGLLKDYLKWLADIVQVFGGVYDFMGDTAFTSNTSNYMDANHFYPEVSKQLMDALFSGRSGKYGTYIDQNNIQQYTQNIVKKYMNK